MSTVNQTAAMGRPPSRDRKLVPPRVRRRRRLLWFSIVPAFVAFLFGVHFAALVPTFERANALYLVDENFDAYQEFKLMRSPNFVDPWKAHFNTGTAAFRADMLYVAEVYLEDALAIVPDDHRCDVQTNLSLVYEATGREYQERAAEEYAWAVAQREAEIARSVGEPYDASLFELDYNDVEITSEERFEDAAMEQRIAADYLARAAAAVNDPACQTPPPPDASQEEQEQAEQEAEQREQEQERLEEEAQQADQERQDMEREAQRDPNAPEEPEPQPGDGDPEDGEGGETEEERAAREEQERQEQLEQRNEDAEEEAGGGGEGSDDDGDEGDSGSGGGPPVSNW